MINKIRILLLLVTAGILGLGAHYLVSSFKNPVNQVHLQPLAAGVDVEIENFKVVKEDEGEEKWTLTAELAQVDKDQNRTRLKNVELLLSRGEKREFRISADSGLLQNDHQEIELQGNVQLVGQSSLVKERLTQNQPGDSPPPP